MPSHMENLLEAGDAGCADSAFEGKELFDKPGGVEEECESSV